MPSVSFSAPSVTTFVARLESIIDGNFIALVKPTLTERTVTFHLRAQYKRKCRWGRAGSRRPE